MSSATSSFSDECLLETAADKGAEHRLVLSVKKGISPDSENEKLTSPLLP